MMKNVKKLGTSFVRTALIATGLILGFVETSPAQTLSWNVDANGSWQTATNWTPNTIPNASTATAVFSTTLITSSRSVSLDANILLGTLQFTSPNSVTTSYSINPGLGNTISLNSGGGGSIIMSAISNQYVNVNIAGTGNYLSIINNGAGELWLNGAVTGLSTGLELSGGGRTILANSANVITGFVNINNGTLVANPGVHFSSTSNVNLSGMLETSGTQNLNRTLGTGAGQLQFGSSGGGFASTTGALTINFNSGGILQLGVTPGFPNTFSSPTLTFGNRTATGQTELRNSLNLTNSTLRVQVFDNFGTDSDITTLSGVISNGSLDVNTAGIGSILASAGTLVLTGTNTYSGNTFVRSGALRANDGQGLPITSQLSLAGILESNGNATFTRTIGSSAGQVSLSGTSPFGFSAFNGTMTVRLNNGADLNWDSSFPSSGILQLGSLSANGLVDFQNNLNLGTLSHTLFVTDNPNQTSDRSRISGVISNSGAGTLSIAGDGILELTASNLQSTTTTVSQKVTLLANNSTGSATGTGPVVIATGATLGGFGRIQPGSTNRVTIQTGGTFQPGTGVTDPTLDIAANGLTLQTGSIFKPKLFGTGASDMGRVIITGTAQINASAIIRLDLADVAANDLRLAVGAGNTRNYTVLTATGGITGGSFTSSNFSLLNAGDFLSSEWTLLQTTGNAVVIQFMPVPEPASFVLLVTATVFASASRRMRRKVESL